MKKFRSLSILLALALVMSLLPSFTVSAAEPGYVYDFYYESDFNNDYTVTGTNQCNVTWEDHALKMVADGLDEIGDPNFYLNNIADAGIDGEDYPYVAFCLKNLTDATEYEGHFGTSSHPISGSTVFHFDVDPNMTEFKTYIFNMPVQNQKYVNIINGPDGVAAQEGATANVVAEMEEGETAWEGTVSTFRFDGMYRGGRSGLSQEGDTLLISWIGFFASEEDAKNYTGPDHSVEKTPEPTADPSTYDSKPYGLLVFNSDDDIFYDFFSETGRNQITDVYFDESKGCWSIDVSAGGDPFIEFAFGILAGNEDMDVVSADDCKILQLGVAVNTAEGAKGGSMYFQTSENGSYDEAKNILYNYVTTDELQCVNIDFSKAKLWTGDVSNCRYDMFTSSKEDTTVDVYYAAFFTNKIAADAFAAQIAEKGLAALPTPAPTPTKAPTAEPTEKPTDAPATDVPVVTDAPETTEEAKATDKGADTDKNGENDTKGNTNKWLVPVIIVAAVVVCAAVVGIIVAKKKKK